MKTISGLTRFSISLTDDSVFIHWFTGLLTFTVFLASSEGLSAVDPIQMLRERYLDPSGLPSEKAYQQALNIAPVPGSEKTDWRVIFKIAYHQVDFNQLSSAKAVSTDCYFVRRTRYTSPFRMQPIWDGRVYLDKNRLVLAAFTSSREQAVGQITAKGLQIDSQPVGHLTMQPPMDTWRYNPFSGQLWHRAPGGQIDQEQTFFLPLPLLDPQGYPIQTEIEIIERDGGRFELIARSDTHSVTLAARCVVNAENTVSKNKGFSPQLDIGCRMLTEEPTVVIEVQGELMTNQIDAQGDQLVLKRELKTVSPPKPKIVIDGRFDDWRSVPGIADPQGDIVSYLQYNPDTDLLQFKIANDAEHLYFYSRVVGQHGNSGAGNDRYYFYVYIDADQDPKTGYIPTRDDDCYYGVAIGDDCEAQFEFVGGRFIKTFFGFTGAATEQHVLSGKVTIAPSWYSRHDSQGKLRSGYKVEYIRNGDQRNITEDYTEGTSDDIVIALSPDGSECEMRAELKGFLQSPQGVPLISTGQRIDLAVGVEAAGKIRGNTNWGADSSAVVHGYLIAE